MNMIKAAGHRCPPPCVVSMPFPRETPASLSKLQKFYNFESEPCKTGKTGYWRILSDEICNTAKGTIGPSENRGGIDIKRN